jgi:hypothetical protein
MDEVVLILSSTEDGKLGLDTLIPLSESLKKAGVTTSYSSVEALVRSRGPAIARKMGLTSFLLADMFTESIVPGGNANASDALDILSLYVSELAPTQSLIIADPYFFGRGADLISRFDRVLGSVLGQVAELTIVHSPQPNATQNFTNLSGHIVSRWPGLTFRTIPSADIHDRFWIADRVRALIVGTSLNTYGSKFCFVEHLSPQDVQDLNHELSTIGI